MRSLLLMIAMFLYSGCAGSGSVTITDGTVFSIHPDSKKILKAYERHIMTLDQEDNDKRAYILEQKDLLNKSFSAPGVVDGMKHLGNYKSACEYINDHNLYIARVCRRLNSGGAPPEDQCDPTGFSSTTSDCSQLVDQSAAIPELRE